MSKLRERLWKRGYHYTNTLLLPDKVLREVIGEFKEELPNPCNFCKYWSYNVLNKKRRCIRMIEDKCIKGVLDKWL